MRADAVKVKSDNAGRFPALGKGEFTYPNIAPAELFCGGVFLRGAEAFFAHGKIREMRDFDFAANVFRRRFSIFFPAYQ